MGNNLGFAGIRNLTWKLAFVLKGFAPAEILDTYEPEMRPCALVRIDTGVRTTEYMARIFAAFYAGEDRTQAIRDTQQYADYDGVVLGFEHKSSLIAENSEPPPATDNPTIDFVTAVRAGRRAPHVWVDEAKGQSVIDWFGLEYVLVAGASVGLCRWSLAVDDVRAQACFPICVRQLPQENVAPYEAQALALVRPDGIIADVWTETDVLDGDVESRLRKYLPLS
ncbi:MAG: FAD-dependent monooxygenase, partial [Gemmatimonadetes bacterium]|nr:FAD-dependent monooxygenase [Gemmatimonadota bacterium]